MVERTQKELITLKGKIIRGPISKIAENGKPYSYVRLRVEEAEKDGQRAEVQPEMTIMFWKDNPKLKEMESTIENLKEEQFITIYGYVIGDGGLFHADEIETDESIFV